MEHIQAWCDKNFEPIFEVPWDLFGVPQGPGGHQDGSRIFLFGDFELKIVVDHLKQKNHVLKFEELHQDLVRVKTQFDLELVLQVFFVIETRIQIAQGSHTLQQIQFFVQIILA